MVTGREFLPTCLPHQCHPEYNQEKKNYTANLYIKTVVFSKGMLTAERGTASWDNLGSSCRNGWGKATKADTQAEPANCRHRGQRLGEPQRSRGHLSEEPKTARPRHRSQHFLVVLQKFIFLEVFFFAAHLVIMWKCEQLCPRREVRGGI